MKKSREKLILELETRRRIYDYILKNPGLHFRALSRDLQIPKTTMDYHLTYLKKNGIIKERAEKGYFRYYITQRVGSVEKDIINIFRQNIPLAIILFLYAYPERSRKAMYKDLRIPITTISYYLKSLIKKDIVEKQKFGRKFLYKLKNNSEMYKFLNKYENSLFRDNTLVDIMNWLKFTSPKEKPKFDTRRLRLSVKEWEELFYEMFPHPYHP